MRMNAIPGERTIWLPKWEERTRTASDLRAALRAGLSTRSLLLILTCFWIYVTVSNVLYARGMSDELDPQGTQQFFASWDIRVLQHLFLYPILLACVFGSLRLGWRPLWRTVPLQLLLAVFFAACANPMMLLVERLFGNPEVVHDPAMQVTFATFLSHMRPLWIASTTLFLLTYGFALALTSGFALYQRFRDSELRLAALERAWSGARLAALRMQLSPHTLFNLLHTIRGQIAWDPPAAQAMIAQLGDLLRRLLAAGERELAPLADELQFVRLYLELQRQRFVDRLTLSLPEIAALPGAWVPSLILQPLVENAVVHGLAGHTAAVLIRVEVGSIGEELVLRVVNTIAAGHRNEGTGIGMRNVRERLAVQFGERASLSAGPNSAGEWVAEVRLPWLRQGSAR